MSKYTMGMDLLIFPCVFQIWKAVSRGVTHIKTILKISVQITWDSVWNMSARASMGLDVAMKDV